MTTQLKKAGTFKEVRTGLNKNVEQASELARVSAQAAKSQATIAKASLESRYAVDAAQGDQRRAIASQNLDAARRQLATTQAEFDSACMYSMQLAANLSNGKARADAEAQQQISVIEANRKKAVRESYTHAFNKIVETASDKLEYGLVVTADRTVAFGRGVLAFFNISAAVNRYKAASDASTINVPEKFKVAPPANNP